MNRNFLTDIGAVLVALVLGVGAGYWYGKLAGFQAGVDSQKEIAIENAAKGINPFDEASTNPFDSDAANPFAGIKTNPFE